MAKMKTYGVLMSGKSTRERVLSEKVSGVGDVHAKLDVSVREVFD